MLLAALTAVEKRRWLNCWTDDETWIMEVNSPAGSWMRIDKELPQRVRQTMGWTKWMLTLFFTVKEFTRVALLPQDASFTTVCFVNSVILPLANGILSSGGCQPSHAAFGFRQF
jgi:hypothetical protein